MTRLTMDKKLISFLEEKIRDFHDILREGNVIFEVSEILDVDLPPNQILVSNIKYFTLDYADKYAQCIYCDVTKDISEYKVTWDTERSKFDLIDPIEIEHIKFETDILDWDNTDLPKEVVDQYDVDLEETGRALEEWYDGIDNIKLNDFPVALHPLIKKSINVYIEYKK